MARLLVVEDNPTTARNLSLYLIGAGHQVYEAYSAEEAKAAADGFRPEIVILSTAMPLNSVKELINQSKNWEARPKVVLTVRRGAEGDCQELIQAGASDFVVKSNYFQNNLITKIQETLTSRSSDWKVTGPLSLERPLFKFRDRRGQGPQIPVHAAFDRRKGGKGRGLGPA